MSIREENEDQCDEASRSPINHYINDADGVWNTIISRLPATALILREMEEVINDAQTLLMNLKTKTNLHNIDSHQLQSSIVNDTNHTSIELTKLPIVIEKKINNKSIELDKIDDLTIVNHTYKSNDSLDKWNEFAGEKGMDPSRPSTVISFHSPSSSSSSSCLFLNAQSTNVFEQAKVGKSMTDDALYEIGKINALNYDSRMKNYESTIAITKQATEAIKNIDSTIPRTTMKDLMLATIKPRVCAHVGDTAINNLHQLSNEKKLQSINTKSPRDRLSSSTSEKPSAIPRRTPNKPRALTHKKSD